MKKKIISLILILSILCAFIQVFFLEYETEALSSSYTQYVKSGISSFPESYQALLNELQELHPNWTFKAYYTGISWSELTSSSAENKCLRNTIYKTDTIDPLSLCICGQSGDSNYYCASSTTVNYYLDPRNSLSEAMVFQFLDLSDGSGVTKEMVQSAVSGTYLEQYVDYIMTAANEAGINPLHIVATIFQELGKSSDTPAAISGTYSGYEGYYNFFNYGATDGSGATSRAMAKAKEMGWNSAYTALVEGTKTVLANNYISAGQTTKYFYKFDVVGNEILTESMGSRTYSSSNFFSHQYMTNVSDPSSQASTLYTMYQDSGILDASLTFVIPVYDDMPSTPCTMATSLTSSDGTLYYINTLNNYSLNVRSSASSSSTSLGKIYRGTIVAVTGTSGTWSQIKLKVATSYNSSSKSWSYKEVTGYVPTEYLALLNTTTAAAFEISGNYINMTPTTTVSTILATYSSATICDINGTNITSSTSTLIGTGATITIDGTTYTVVKYGDINGDGTIDSMDMYLLIQYLLGNMTYNDFQEKASDTNNDSKIDSMDMYQIIQHLLGNSFISI